jgi:hypothetical protein
VLQDSAKDVAQDVSQDSAKDVAQDVSQDSAKDALQDVSQDSLKDVLQDASQVVPIIIGAIVFIVFHLIFPNRQERFLLPAVPFVLLLMIRTIYKRYPCEASCKASCATSFAESCETSFEESCNTSFEESWLHKAMRWSIYLSAIYTVAYSFYIPKSKYLEASKVLYERGDFQNVVIDNWKGEESVWLPMHYVGKFVHPFSMTNKKSLDQLKQQITHQSLYDSKRLPSPAPNYLIIWGREEAYLRAKAYEQSGFQLQRLSPANSEAELGFALYHLTFSYPLLPFNFPFF